MTNIMEDTMSSVDLRFMLSLPAQQLYWRPPILECPMLRVDELIPALTQGYPSIEPELELDIALEVEYAVSRADTVGDGPMGTSATQRGREIEILTARLCGIDILPALQSADRTRLQEELEDIL
jgi:hypothetical protein